MLVLPIKYSQAQTRLSTLFEKKKYDLLVFETRKKMFIFTTQQASMDEGDHSFHRLIIQQQRLQIQIDNE